MNSTTYSHPPAKINQQKCQLSRLNQSRLIYKPFFCYPRLSQEITEDQKQPREKGYKFERKLKNFNNDRDYQLQANTRNKFTNEQEIKNFDRNYGYSVNKRDYVHPKYLSQEIRECQSMENLLQLYLSHRDIVDHISVSSLFVQTWKIVGYQRNKNPLSNECTNQVVEELVEFFLTHSSSFDPKGLANMTKTLSSLQWPAQKIWIKILANCVIRNIEKFSAYNCALMLQGLNGLNLKKNSYNFDQIKQNDDFYENSDNNNKKFNVNGVQKNDYTLENNTESGIFQNNDNDNIDDNKYNAENQVVSQEKITNKGINRDVDIQEKRNQINIISSILLDRYCITWESGNGNDFGMVVCAVQRSNIKVQFDQLNVMQRAIKKFVPKMTPQKIAKYSVFLINQFPAEKSIHDIIIKNIIRRGQQFYGPQEITSLLQFLAKINQIDESFFNYLVNQAQNSVLKFSGRQAAYCIFSLGEIYRVEQRQNFFYSSEIKQLVVQLIPIVLTELNYLECHVVAMLPKAFATLRIYDLDLFSKIAEFIDPQKLYSPQIINILWAYAALLSKQPNVEISNKLIQQLIDSLILQCKYRFQNFNNQQIVSCILSLSKIRHRDPKLLNQCVEIVIQFQNDFSLIMLATLLNSFAVLNFNRFDFINLVVQKLLQQTVVNARDVCNVMLNLCVLDAYADDALHISYMSIQHLPHIQHVNNGYNQNMNKKFQKQSLFQQYVNQLVELLQRTEIFQENDFRQIFQCFLLSHKNEKSWFFQLSEKHQQQSKKAYKKYLLRQLSEKRGLGLSDFSKQIYDILQNHRFKCEINQLLDQACIGELVVFWGEQKLVVYADGASRFCSQYPFVPTGQTIARNKILANLGIKFVSIPFFEWGQLIDWEQKEEFVVAIFKQYL